jgi:hypothetical protein
VLNQKQLYKVLEFPKHLQVSLTTLLKIGSASSEQVAGATGKARAVESCYLNQLAIMHIVKKEHRSRTIFFVLIWRR